MFPILNPAPNLPPHTIPLGHPSAPAPSILYYASNLDWQFVSHMILYMFQCHFNLVTNIHNSMIRERIGLFQGSKFSWFNWAKTSSVSQFSRSVVSDSLRPHESQHARPPCPSPTPGVHSDSRPSSQWCHPAISSSVIPSPPAPNPSQHQSLFQWVNRLLKFI